jgi:hypothetical protein
MSFVLQPWQFLILILAGSINSTQRGVIEYLPTENRTFREKLGGRAIDCCFLYYPLSRALPLFTPFGPRTASQAFNNALFLEVAKSQTYHIAARSRASTFNLAQGE